MANAEKILYAAGNPHVYEPVPPESAYWSVARENARLLGLLSISRGQTKEACIRAERAEDRAFWSCLGLGVYVMGTLLGLVYYFAR